MSVTHGSRDTRRYFGALATACLLFMLDARAATDDSDAALAVIQPEAIRADMRFLSDDLLEGRGTGTRGHQLAAQFMATQFESMGLARDALYLRMTSWFRDMVQIEEAEARVVEEWMIRVLTQAALLESRAKEGKPLRSIFQRGTKKQKYG